jgi:hypothetical protein
MGDTECSQQILEGTYDYPPDTDIWMKKILKEIQHTFSCMSGKEIATTISTSNNIEGGLMKGHHHQLAVLPSLITRLSHLT